MSVKKPYTSRKIIIAIAGILITILLIKLINPKPDLIGKIDKLREETKPMFDSLSKQINEDNKFHANVRGLIQEKDFDLATKLVDSALKKSPKNNLLYTYKGMIMAGQGHHLAAIELYNKSMSNTGEFPFALSQRAASFLELKEYKDAISDCKKAAEMNIDFTYQLAQTFEKAKLIDSAILYYSKYCNAYPKEIEVRQHLNYLTSLKKK